MNAATKMSPTFRIGFLLMLIIEIVATYQMKVTENASCPDTAQCICTTINGEFEYQCPKILIRHKSDAHIQIECNPMADDPYKLLPEGELSIGNIPFVQIRRCPLPTNTSIKELLERIDVKEFFVLQFQSNGYLKDSLKRRHLNGLENLQRLVLFGNGLTKLDDDLFTDMGNLKQLDLRSNALELSRDIFVNLTKLETLELGSNSLQSLAPGIFRNQHALMLLNLWGNRLHNLTNESFDNVTSITDLDLSANQLETIRPELLSDLPNLTNINLNANSFKELPDNLLNKNTKLTTFRLMENRVQMERLPSHFLANLPGLLTVRIKCELVHLPANVFSGSTNITNITLASNKIVVLAKGLLDDQTELIDLELSKNELATIDVDLFKKTKSLVILRMAFNRLVDIPSLFFKNLLNLRVLMLNNNRIKHIHKNAFFGLEKVETINLENNEIVELSFFTAINSDTETVSLFTDLRNLKTLNLRNNKIISLAGFAQHGPDLKELDFRNNRLGLFNFDDLQLFGKNVSVNMADNFIERINFRDYADILFANQNGSARVTTYDFSDNRILCDCFLMHFVLFLQDESLSKLNTVYHIKNSYDLQCASPHKFYGNQLLHLNVRDLICPLDSPNNPAKLCPENCDCHYRTIDHGVIIDCANRGLTEMPVLPELPPTCEYIELHVENNNITSLPSIIHPKYQLIKEIYAANNFISSLSLKNLPKNLTVLSLTNNLISSISSLEYLPQKLTILSLANNSMRSINATLLNALGTVKPMTNLSLGGNPWSCDCTTMELLKFIIKNDRLVTDRLALECFGKPMLNFASNDICSQSLFYVKLGVCIALLGITFGAFVAFLCIFENEIKIWLYAHDMLLSWVTEEELDKDKVYDAFVSFSHKDRDFVNTEIMKELEKGNPPFKLCTHERDWLGGEMIAQQIINSVELSRRTIVVLSNNFITSDWSNLEFTTAHDKTMKQKRPHLIVIIYGELDNADKLSDNIKKYLDTNTYIKYDNNDPWFWKKLRYALPHKQAVKRMTKSVDDKLELINPSPSGTPTATTPPAENWKNSPLKMLKNGMQTPEKEVQPSTAARTLNGHVNNGYIVNRNSKQSDV